MSFIQKLAGLLACLIISIISVLGRLSACCGSTCFRHFYRNDSLPFLIPYKQLDAGLTYSSKIASVCCYLTWFWTPISLKFSCSWKIFPSCHPFLDYFYRFKIIAFFSKRFF